MELTKAEVNERYYEAVGGDIVFLTEAKGFLHPFAAGKLLAAHARAAGKRRLKLLELGANDCAFAVSLLKILSGLAANGEVALDAIDYFAVERARPSLERFLDAARGGDDFHQARPGAPGSPLVGTLVRLGVPQVTLHLVGADARRFVAGGAGGYDFAVCNELLDDLACRVFHTDGTGAAHELHARAREEGGGWHVAVAAEPAALEAPPGTLTVTSPDGVAVATGAAALLAPGGMLLVHDYGFAERHTPAARYRDPPRSLPAFVTLELPPDAGPDFPRSFFRVFGNAERNVVQITTDVAFAELVEALAPAGTAIVLPHGNALLAARGDGDDLRAGDGVFLSEFGLLEPDDDLDALLARLDAEQAELRARYAGEYVDGRATVFSDLLFVRR